LRTCCQSTLGRSGEQIAEFRPILSKRTFAITFIYIIFLPHRPKYDY
ncbi:unnamed protein product, partial [Allacma fusca]